MNSAEYKTCISCRAEPNPKLLSEIAYCNRCYDEQIEMLLEYKKKKKYSDPQMDLIIERLFLGNEDAGKKEDLLKQNGVTHILVAGSYMDQCFPDQFQYKVLMIRDFPQQEIKQYFQECYDFIHEARSKEGVVFVHCAAGVSRSASIVISYLMKLNSWGFEQAFKFVKGKRSKIFPNSGFISQLQTYEEEILKSTQ